MPKVTIARNILATNDAVAEAIRQTLRSYRLRTLNIMSSPGAGKTTLLEQSVKRLRGLTNIGVIEGDIETTADAARMEAAGAATVQINTRGACHLEAHMIRDALKELDIAQINLLIIENIGNLVCPSAWDLGEDARMVLVSVTEGDDKPAKYPHMFANAHIMGINKLDLLPYVDYDLAKVKQQALAINPHLRLFEFSCRSGAGLEPWCNWLHAFATSERVGGATAHGPVGPGQA